MPKGKTLSTKNGNKKVKFASKKHFIAQIQKINSTYNGKNLKAFFIAGVHTKAKSQSHI